MKVICLLHQKGGVGKTTLTLNLAYCFKYTGLQVAIIDTDLQGSISDLEEIMTGIDLIKIQDISTCGKDIILIDTPPYLSEQLPQLLQLSDYAIVPTKAGYFDVLAIKATIAIISEAQKRKPALKAGVLLNMIKPQASITERIKEILNGYEIPTLKSIVTDRVSYASSPITNSVFGSQDEKAQNEIIALTNELLDQL